MNKADTKKKVVPWEQYDAYDAIADDTTDRFTACYKLSELCREKDKQIDFLQKDNTRLFFLLNPKPEVE